MRSYLQVKYATDIRPSGVNRGVKDVAGLVDAQLRRSRVEHVAVEVDLDQVAGSDFVVEQAEWIDEDFRG